MDKNRQKRRNRKAEKIVPEFKNSAGSSHAIKTDPLGSYTGRPDNPYEKPVQDADDL